MNEIERLNLGLVVRATINGHPQTPPRRVVALTDRSRKRVLAELARRTRAGEIESAGALQLISSGPLAGQYAVRVVLLDNPRPRRNFRWMLPAGVLLLGLGALVAGVAWFLTALSAASLAGLCVILLATLGLAVAAGGKRRGGGNVTVISQINVGR